jgi:hypothetical protein
LADEAEEGPVPKVVSAAFDFVCKITESVSLGGGGGTLGGTFDRINRFISGTGAGAGNDWWSRNNSVTAGAAFTATLSALVDDAGRSCPFTKIRGIGIRNNGGGVLLIGGAATHAWTGFLNGATEKLKVPDGGSFCLTAPDAAGMAVAVGADDQLKIDAVSGTVAYQIVLYGED